MTSVILLFQLHFQHQYESNFVQNPQEHLPQSSSEVCLKYGTDLSSRNVLKMIKHLINPVIYTTDLAFRNTRTYVANLPFTRRLALGSYSQREVFMLTSPPTPPATDHTQRMVLSSTPPIFDTYISVIQYYFRRVRTILSSTQGDSNASVFDASTSAHNCPQRRVT